VPELCRTQHHKQVFQRRGRRVLASALRPRAETAARLTTGEVGHHLASILISQVLRLSLRCHPPHFSSSQGSHLCRPSVGIPHSTLPTQGHIPCPMAGVPHDTLLGLLLLPQKLDHLLRDSSFCSQGSGEDAGRFVHLPFFEGPRDALQVF